MGIFIKSRIKLNSHQPGSPVTAHDILKDELTQRIINLENDFMQLKELYHSHAVEIESRAEFCRDEMVSGLKTALALERRKNEKLAFNYGRLKERHHLFLNKFKK